VYGSPEPLSVREGVGEIDLESNTSELTVINCHHRNQRNHCNQFSEQIAFGEVHDAPFDERGTFTQEEQRDGSLERKLCPHHPQARLVRFDPAGQAWCDKMDCWDCFRLMKIGEALEFRCVKDLGGKVVIEEGMAAWSAFVLASRAFLVVVATEEAIAMCKALDIEVPDVSDEVKRLVEVHPAPS
jgi:hypothetical protein